MSSLPSLIINFHPPHPDQHVALTITSVSGVETRAELRLPFALEHAALLLGAINRSQHQDQLGAAGTIGGEPDADALHVLRGLGLWANGPVVDVRDRVGRLLGAALFADPDLRRAMATLHDVAARFGEGELVLHFDQGAAALAALPWELTYFADRPLLIAGGALLSCTRVIAAGEFGPDMRTRGAALRVLALAPRAGFDEQLRRAEREARRQMTEAVRGLPVIIEEMSPVTMPALRSRLSREPIDIIDLLGHGRFANNGGQLLLDDGTSEGEWVPAERLAALPDLPPLMVLHACQAGRLHAHSPFAGVATALSMANVQAVLAMQLDNFASSASRSFIPTFYRQLAAGRSLQRALAEARRALYTDEQPGANWYVPALYLRQSEPQPFRLLEPPPNPFAGLGALHDARMFIGRPALLRRLWDRLGAGGNLAIIGPPESGKSTLLRYIAAATPQRFGPGVEVFPLSIHRDLRRDAISAELVTLLGGRQRSDLQRLLRGRRIILLLDDLGLLSPDGHGLDVRQWLRGLSQTRVNGTVQLVTTSKQPLAKLFVDRHDDVSPLHNTLRDMIELGPFDEVEARRFIAQGLRGTLFSEDAFADLLGGSLMPGALQEACRARYDELQQRWE